MVETQIFQQEKLYSRNQALIDLFLVGREETETRRNRKARSRRSQV